MDDRMKIRKLVAITILVLSSFAASNVAPSKAELEVMYDKAFREFDANNFSEALKQLDAIDARQPDLAESQNLRGVILMRQGIYDKAEAALHEALRIDPKFWNARFNLAEIPFLEKNWSEARARFQDLLSNNVSELQGDAAQLIQYKVLLTYLMEGKENMVDSILAKFELSTDTPAVHYANAAIALQRKNTKEARDWMAAAEKNFSPQLNKLFAESLYEIGWLEKQAGQSRAALELATPSEKAAKTKAFARSRFEQAQQAFQQRDFAGARKFIDEADAADPNQAAILNLRGEILMEQKEFEQAEATFKKAIKLDPKFREAQYNLAQVPFKKKDYAKARERFENLFSQTPGGDKNQAAQLIKFKIFMSLLLEGKESRAQKMMEQFQFTGDTPALYYAQAAWEFKHNNPNKAVDWISSAKKIYSPALNIVFADAFYDLGWMQSPAVSGSPGPAAEAATVMSAVPTEASPAIEPSPIPGTTAAASKQAKEAKETKVAKEASAASSPVAGMEATTSRTEPPPVIAFAPNTATGDVSAAGTPAKPEDLASAPVPALSPTVETTPAAAASPSASIAAATEAAPQQEAPAIAQASVPEEKASTTPAPVVAASATPATALAPSHVRDVSRPTLGESLSRIMPDRPTLLFAGLILAALGLIAWVAVPYVRRWAGNVSLYRQPTPAVGLHIADGNGNGAVPAPAEIMKHRFVGGPRQISLQLKASEPSLRRSVHPVGKPVGRPFTPAPAVGTAPAMPSAVGEPPVQRASDVELDVSPFTETSVEAVGPVIEQDSVSPVEEHPSNGEISPSDLPASREISRSEEWMAPTLQVEDDQHSENPDVAEASPRFETQMPEVESRMPEVAPEIPNGQVQTPELEPRIPQVEEEIEAAPTETQAQSTMPRTEEEMPNIETETAEIESRLPDLEAEKPEVESPILDTKPVESSLEEVVTEEPEPVGQGQPVPHQVPVTDIDSPGAEGPPILPPVETAPPSRTEVATSSNMSEIEAVRQTETPAYSPKITVNEPSFLQSTTTEIMPETTQMQTAPVIRTPATGSTPQPTSAMHTAVQLSFSFDIASMQLTPTFKMGALQLRPTSKIVTMRLAPAQHPQPAMNLQVTFELAKIQPAGGGLGSVRLIPSQQQRPQIVGSPSFTVAGLQLVSNFEAAPVQLTPSQQAAVMVTAAFQIATVEFSPSFEIASIVLNSSSKQVAVQLAGTGSIETAPMFDIANLQLGPSGEIGMMQLNLLGQAGRRA
jgi:tetratricopeptide (TPR) repeat protein